MTYAQDMKDLRATLENYWKNKKEELTMEQVFQWMKLGYIAGAKSNGVKK
jgi:hypothetical protein